MATMIDLGESGKRRLSVVQELSTEGASLMSGFCTEMCRAARYWSVCLDRSDRKLLQRRVRRREARPSSSGSGSGSRHLRLAVLR